MKNKGQVTIFIIIAVVIVALAAVFFAFKGSLFAPSIPVTFESAYNTFLSCIEEETMTAISIAENQAGHIELPAFEAGNNYMPFSSQLDFLGNPIPYWYYVSGNNIQREQVPSKSEIEEQIGNFVEENIKDCTLDEYYSQGLEITLGETNADVRIGPGKVDVSLDMDMSLAKGDESAVVRNHDVSINSKLGTLYGAALEVYNHEQETLFLENYALDTLGLYAPVDGVEISCSPLTWNAQDVFDDLHDGLEANTQSLKTKTTATNERDYFVEDLSVDADVRFLTSKEWPYSFDVGPSEGSILLASPIGNQPGLGVLGFCYTPYHFVYDVKYPVLVQVFSGNEVFQFPVAVVIQGNNPREALDATAISIELPEICRNNNTKIQVKTFDTKLNPVNADISYECFGTKCEIGKTTAGAISSNFPQCANGNILAKAPGFKDTKYQFSTIDQGSVEVIMDRMYEMNVNLKVDNADYSGQATISFVSDDGTVSSMVIYPNQKKVNLSEGQYEIQVWVYKNSSVKLGATTSEQCIDVPQSNVGGFFGLTKEKCFTIEFPEQIISNALAGGGVQKYYILESELSSHNAVEINAGSLPVPTSIDQLNDNYLLFDDKNLQITFK